MTPYPSEGMLTTDEREVAISETWDSWSNPQSMSNVVVSNGIVMLEEVVVVDNYEAADADPSGPYASGETIADYYGGDTGSFSRQTGTVRAGSHALQHDAPDNNSKFIYSTASEHGLPNYPAKGDVFECWTRWQPQTASNQIHFGASGTMSFYDLNFDMADNGFELRLWDGGFDSELDSASASLSSGNWYRAEVEWHDGSGSESDNTIVARLFDSNGTQLASLSATDSTHATVEGIGFRGNVSGSEDTGQHQFFDEYLITGSV